MPFEYRGVLIEKGSTVSQTRYVMKFVLSPLHVVSTVTFVVGDGVEIDYALVGNPNFSHPGIIVLDMKVVQWNLR